MCESIADDQLPPGIMKRTIGRKKVGNIFTPNIMESFKISTLTEQFPNQLAQGKGGKVRRVRLLLGSCKPV